MLQVRTGLEVPSSPIIHSYPAQSHRVTLPPSEVRKPNLARNALPLTVFASKASLTPQQMGSPSYIPSSDTPQASLTIDPPPGCL